jgi:hypothetical protein
MTEELDRTKRRCAICGRADLPAYSFVAGMPACCFGCLSALAAREVQRLQPKQDTTK